MSLLKIFIPLGIGIIIVLINIRTITAFEITMVVLFVLIGYSLLLLYDYFYGAETKDEYHNK